MTKKIVLNCTRCQKEIFKSRNTTGMCQNCNRETRKIRIVKEKDLVCSFCGRPYRKYKPFVDRCFKCNVEKDKKINEDKEAQKKKVKEAKVKKEGIKSKLGPWLYDYDPSLLPKERKCINCKSVFTSYDDNRICDPCKKNWSNDEMI